jgi:hypothetical protein
MVEKWLLENGIAGVVLDGLYVAPAEIEGSEMLDGIVDHR